jgi:protein tyrosine/serine phosphatase
MTRHIDFDGIENFRDFGGYHTALGAPLKRGVLYRSANHHYATEADLQRMRELNLACIVDLRRPEERTREPSKRWPGFEAAVLENDILSNRPDWLEVMGDSTPDADWFLKDGVHYYEHAPFEPRHLDLFSRYFHTLAELDGAVVVHCAAGKDRTGLICALTHHLAGVHHDDIVADYLLTNDEDRIERKMGFLRTWLREVGGKVVADEALRTAVSVHPSYLETAFKVIEREFGSLDGYMQRGLGVDAALRERVLVRILEA